MLAPSSRPTRCSRSALLAVMMTSAPSSPAPPGRLEPDVVGAADHDKVCPATSNSWLTTPLRFSNRQGMPPGRAPAARDGERLPVSGG